MPQLIPFFFVNQVVFNFILLTVIIYVFSKYLLPRFVRLFKARLHINSLKQNRIQFLGFPFLFYLVSSIFMTYLSLQSKIFDIVNLVPFLAIIHTPLMLILIIIFYTKKKESRPVEYWSSSLFLFTIILILECFIMVLSALSNSNGLPEAWANLDRSLNNIDVGSFIMYVYFNLSAFFTIWTWTESRYPSDKKVNNTPFIVRLKEYIKSKIFVGAILLLAYVIIRSILYLSSMDSWLFGSYFIAQWVILSLYASSKGSKWITCLIILAFMLHFKFFIFPYVLSQLLIGVVYSFGLKSAYPTSINITKPGCKLPHIVPQEIQIKNLFFNGKFLDCIKSFTFKDLVGLYTQPLFCTGENIDISLKTPNEIGISRPKIGNILMSNSPTTSNSTDNLLSGAGAAPAPAPAETPIPTSSTVQATGVNNQAVTNGPTATGSSLIGYPMSYPNAMTDAPNSIRTLYGSSVEGLDPGSQLKKINLRVVSAGSIKDVKYGFRAIISVDPSYTHYTSVKYGHYALCNAKFGPDTNPRVENGKLVVDLRGIDSATTKGTVFKEGQLPIVLPIDCQLHVKGIPLTTEELSPNVWGSNVPLKRR